MADTEGGGWRRDAAVEAMELLKARAPAVRAEAGN
jgi:hypothetical protein